MATALASTETRNIDGAHRTPGSSWTLATVLYGDLEDSTALLHHLGDEHWLEVLHTYRFIVAQRVEARGGDRPRTWGDGFVATFPHSTQGQRAAVEIQRALARFSAHHPESPLRARLGIHTGRVIAVGDDCYGVTVHFAARLADAADGGQILVSAEARAAGGLPDSNYNPERRLLRLKGWCDPQTAYELSWRDDTGMAGSRLPVSRVILL